MTTKAEIVRFLPNANPALVDAIVGGWALAEAEGINTPRRVRHFLTQIATETGGLRAVEESLNYSSAARIREVWPTRFKTEAAAKPYVRNPKALAIKVYGGRLGNAAAPATDGWDYRGGGMLQTTGRDNHRKMGFEENPEALRDPDTAFETAVREWANRGCNALADADDLEAVRRKINGGLNGIAEAREFMRKAKAVWPDQPGKPIVAQVEDKPRPAAPTPAQKKAASPELIEAIQRALIAKGYNEVGEPDGKFGSKTRGSILAFEADHALPLTGLPSGDLLEAVMAAEAREVSPSRADGKPENSAALKATTPQLLLGGGLGFGALTSAAEPLVKSVEGGAGLVYRVKGALEPIIELWPLLALAAAGAVIYFAWRSRKAVVDDYRTGKLTR